MSQEPDAYLTPAVATSSFSGQTSWLVDQGEEIAMSVVQTYSAFAYNNAWANHRLLGACSGHRRCRCPAPTASIPTSRGRRMFERPTKRGFVVALIALIAATAITIEGTYYALYMFVIDDVADPLTK
jgi:hypothetical protein